MRMKLAETLVPKAMEAIGEVVKKEVPEIIEGSDFDKSDRTQFLKKYLTNAITTFIQFNVEPQPNSNLEAIEKWTKNYFNKWDQLPVQYIAGIPHSSGEIRLRHNNIDVVLTDSEAAEYLSTHAESCCSAAAHQFVQHIRDTGMAYYPIKLEDGY